ncbi:protein TIS11-like [Diaphorina citri]|uniref:Protein TIS11-like n=1 Tax=Diaphorina citri TaxID=121845 RepID=A0A1S4ESW5_DIACI|nr:protein TIS11-like [Diaphorina citri]
MDTEKYYHTHYPWDHNEKMDKHWASLRPATEERYSSKPTDTWNANGRYSHFYHSRENLFKTELCRLHDETGVCKFGTGCKFAHGAHELRVIPRHPRYRTKLCQSYHQDGFCPYGQRCYFIHEEKSVSSRGTSVTSSVSSRGSGKISLSSCSSDQDGQEEGFVTSY